MLIETKVTCSCKANTFLGACPVCLATRLLVKLSLLVLARRNIIKSDSVSEEAGTGAIVGDAKTVVWPTL